jgi:leucine-rich repeat-containing G protein-coupled receptor 7
MIFEAVSLKLPFRLIIGVAIPAELYAWLAVFALPVNSALNPIIYTLTTKLFKQQVSKSSILIL